ncbi:hypothetical protein EMCRGX_G011469 [Ephydatia muelleri]
MVWNRNSCAERGVVPGMRRESRPETTGGVSQYASDERMPQRSSTAAYVQKGENDICDDGKEIAEAEDWESTVKENRGMGSIGAILLRYRLQEQGEPSLPVFIRQSNQLSICQ